MKVRGKVKKLCRDCFMVKRRGRLYNLCRSNPKHKHRSPLHTLAAAQLELLQRGKGRHASEQRQLQPRLQSAVSRNAATRLSSTSSGSGDSGNHGLGNVTLETLFAMPALMAVDMACLRMAAQCWADAQAGNSVQCGEP